jgi:hypothetical protein
MFSTKSSTYQANVGALQGADFAFFGDAAIHGKDIENWIRSDMTVTEQAISGSVLENSLFSPAYGHHVFSCPTGQSKCSMKLPLPSVGMKLYIDWRKCITDANISIFASTGGGVTGVSLVRATGSALSSLEMSALGYVAMVCTTAGTWSIVSSHPSCDENVAT